MNDSSPSPGLARTIARAKDAGIGDLFLADLLRHQGHSARAVYRAFAAHYAEALALDTRADRADGARDAAIYLIDFAMLATAACAFGNLVFRLIDRFLPDAANLYPDAYGSFDVSGDIAALLVAVPLFLFLEWRTQRGFSEGTHSSESGVRRWLTYLALVVTAATEVGDVIWFLTDFLRGSLSSHFVAQALTIGAITGTIFVYETIGLRRREGRA